MHPIWQRASHACDPNTSRVEAGQTQVPGQLGLHCETLALAQRLGYGLGRVLSYLSWTWGLMQRGKLSQKALASVTSEG